ncbi:hypothetical protein ACVWYN_000036 [Pedobacter sp. UYP24]
MKALLQRVIELLTLFYQVLSGKHEPNLVLAEEEVWLDSWEVREKLNIASSTLYRAREGGLFTSKKLGKKWFYLKSSLCVTAIESKAATIRNLSKQRPV